MPKRKAGADGAVDPPTKRSKTINNAVPATRQMRSTASGGTTYSVENAKPIRKSSRTTRPQRQTGANALTERTNEFVASSSERRSAADESGSEDELQVLSVSKSAVRGRGKAKAKDTAEHSPDELARAEPALAKRGRTRKTVASGPAPKPAVTRGRRRKETAIQKEVAEQDELGESIVLAVPTTPKKRGRPAKASVVDTGREVTRASPRKNTTAATALSIPKRALGRPKQIAVTESTPIESPTNNRSASRSAKAPARDEWEPEDSDSDPPQLLRQLGAETPTRRGRGRIPASASAKVVHDVEPSTPSRRGKAIQPRTLSPPKIREDLLFSTRKKTQAKPRKTVQIQESDDELVVDSAPKLPSLQDLAKKQASRVSRPLPRLPGSDAEKGDMVHTLKSHVLQKLCGKPTTTKRENLMGLDDEYARVHHLLEQTVAAGEGNSMLLIGSRGVGKSLLVDTAINDLQETYKGDFLVVRLNGFFQTDDKLASREIWRQLGVEMDSEEGTGIDGIQPKTSNFGDTLSSILAVLSHPSEHAGEDDGGLTENKTAVSVIFVLEEFDLFVTHPRQALLYNLFDIAQARKAPIAVLGLTSRIDVVESLEKRVKSRFSHRTVHIKLPNSLERYWETCRRGLEVDVEQLEAEAQREKNEIEYFEKWNEELEELYEEEAIFRNFVRRLYAESKDVRAFYNAMLLPVTSLTTETPFLTAEQISGHALAGPELKLDILDGLNDLEMSLLIAAARLEIVTDSENINFSMAYDEYSRMSSEMRIQSSIASSALSSQAKIWGRDVAMAAWEKLADYELVVPGVLGGGGREHRMWRVEVSLRDVGRFIGKRVGHLSKWCRI